MNMYLNKGPNMDKADGVNRGQYGDNCRSPLEQLSINEVLPLEITELILSKLSLKDQCGSANVCKSWNSCVVRP